MKPEFLDALADNYLLYFRPLQYNKHLTDFVYMYCAGGEL